MYTKSKLRKTWERLLRPVFKVFRRLGLKPTHITLIGSALIMLGCFFLLYDYRLVAFLSFTLGGVCDAVDGAYARGTNQVTAFGGFFDSVIDRYNEFALAGCVLFLNRENEWLYFFCFILFLGIGLMSYTRALFEKNGFTCPENPFEYFERGLLFLVFLAADRLDLWLLVTAVGTHFFLAGRILRFYVLCTKIPAGR